MAKDKGIGELAGIAPAAVVGLSRVGIVSVADLVAADFDQVAYIVDDYNEAARLLREASKDVPGAIPAASRRARAAHHDGPGVATPVVRSPVKGHPINRAASATISMRSKEEPRESPAPVHSPAPAHSPASLSAAMDLALQGLSLAPTEAGAADRATLRRRLDAAGVLLEHGADEKELCAALSLEPAETGAIQPSEIAKRFGDDVATLIEECTSLRAIPMLPSGNLPRSYMDIARAASTQARRVCAAYLLSTDRRGGAAWHARLLSEALASGSPDELITLARSSVERSAERAAA